MSLHETHWPRLQHLMKLLKLDLLLDRQATAFVQERRDPGLALYDLCIFVLVIVELGNRAVGNKLCGLSCVFFSLCKLRNGVVPDCKEASIAQLFIYLT